MLILTRHVSPALWKGLYRTEEVQKENLDVQHPSFPK